MRFSMKKKLRESALRARRRHLHESKKHSEAEVFEDMVDDIAEELKNLTSRRVFNIAVDDERAHEGKEELLDSILSFIGGSVAARFEDEHNISDVDGIEAAEEAAKRLGRKSLENDFWKAFKEEKKDISESRFRARRGRLHESADKDEVVDYMIGELEGLVLSEVFFDSDLLESWTEAKDVIEDYIVGVTQDRILDSDKDLYDAFDDAVKELGGWDKVKKLVKWNEYAKKMGVKESRFHKSRNMLKESRELRRMKLLAGMFKRA